MQWLDSEICSRVALILWHVTWSGAVLTLLGSLAANWMTQKASVRYWIYCGTLVALLGLIPFWSSITSPPFADDVIALREETSPADAVVLLPAPPPDSGPVALERSTPPMGELAVIAAVRSENLKESIQPDESHSLIIERVVQVVTLCYAIGLFAMLVRLFVSLWGGERLRSSGEPVKDVSLLDLMSHHSQRLGLKFVPMLRRCERVAAPVVVGIVRPVVLIPTSMLIGLTPDQLSVVLIHELAHLRRYDHIMLLGQRVAEAVLFFHPAVWYLSRQIDHSREEACDDLVLAQGGDALEYAQSLLRVAELRLGPSTQLSALSVEGSKPSILRRRIARLLGASEVPKVRLTRAGVVTLVVSVIGMVSLSLAFAKVQVSIEEKPDEQRDALLQLEKYATSVYAEGLVDGQFWPIKLTISNTPVISCNLWGPRTEALRLLPQLPDLERLGIHSCETRDGLEAIRSLKNLKRLEIAGAQFTAADFGILDSLPQLESFSANMVYQVTQGLDWYESQLPNLTEQQQEFLNSRLAGVSNSESMRITCYDAFVNDAGLRALKPAPHLKSFTLMNASITDAGFRWIIGNPNLQEIEVTGQLLTAEALQELRNCPNLERIEIGWAPWTPEALQVVSELKNLKRLRMWYPSVRVSEQSVELLRQALPDCEILLTQDEEKPSESASAGLVDATREGMSEGVVEDLVAPVAEDVIDDLVEDVVEPVLERFVEGVVLTPDGVGVAGAEVAIVPYTESGESVEILASSITDSTGAFRIPITADLMDSRQFVGIWGRAEGYVPQRESSVTIINALVRSKSTVKLYPATETTVEVLDANRKPVEKVKLRMSHVQTVKGVKYKFPEPWLKDFEGITDADGKVTVRNISPETVRQFDVELPSGALLRFDQDYFLNTKPVPNAPHFTIPAPEVGQVNGVLEWTRPSPENSNPDQMFDESQALSSQEFAEMLRHPPSGGGPVVVTLMTEVTKPPFGTSAGITGFATIPLTEPQFQAVMPIGRLTVTTTMTAHQPLQPQIPNRLNVNPNESTDLLIPVQQGVKVRGQIRKGDTKEGISNFILRLIYGPSARDVNGYKHSVELTTDDQGYFTAYVPPGPVRIRIDRYVQGYRDVESWNDGPWNHRDKPLLVPAGSEEFELPPVDFDPTQEVEGTLVDTEGRPLVDWVVSGFPTDWEEQYGGQKQPINFVMNSFSGVHTNKEGKFAGTVPISYPPGRWKVSHRTWPTKFQFEDLNYIPRIRSRNPLILEVDPESMLVTDYEDSFRDNEVVESQAAP